MNIVKIFVMLVVLIGLAACVQAQVVNKVVAVVNNEIITQHDVDQLLAVLYAQQVQEYKGDELLERMEDSKKDILKRMIEDKLILSRAREMGVNVSEDDVDAKLELIKSGFPSEEAFQKTMQMQGITVSDLKARYRDQIMMKKIINFEIKSKVSVLPSEIAEYYEKHREEFKQDEKYRVRHILIKAEDDVGFELARVEAQDIYDKLMDGQDFAEIAKKYSHGPNKEQGGDMGYIGRGEMLEELDRVIFELREGEFSSPVKSRVGYHIFKVEKIKHSGYFSLEDVKVGIEQVIFQKKLKEKLDEWLVELRTGAYISIK